MVQQRIKTAMTAEQIAKRVGMSNATVSRVLNNAQYVSSDAREAVMAVIREIGETPKLLGRRSKPKVSVTDHVEIVMFNLFPEPSGQQIGSQRAMPWSRLAEGITGELRTVGLRGVVQTTSNLADAALLLSINQPDNRGVFLFGIYDESVHAFLEKCRVPVVSFMSWQHNGWPDYVGIDNTTGVQLALDHLHALGHTKIGYVAGQLEFSHVFRQRLAAYKMWMLDAGLTWRPEWISEGSCDVNHMEPSVHALLNSPDRPTAVLCAFSTATLAIRRAADRLNLSVPEDLSVVGFDDDEIAQLFSPPLTTLRIPLELMGRHAVQLMAIRQARPIVHGEGVSVRVTPSLIVRQSTAAPAKA